MGDVVFIIGLPVKGDFIDINIFSTVLRSTDLDLLPVFE